MRARAAQYLRMSTDNQRYSLENQAAAIESYAAEHAYDIVRSYEDAGRSGLTTAGRDGLKALLRDVLNREMDYAVILVLDVSRWGRFQDPDEAAHYEFLCRAAGVSVVYCAEAFENDGSTSSTIIKHLKRVMAAEYSKQLSDRCRAGKRRQVESGCAPGGAPPYGFRRQVFNVDGSPGPILQRGERRSRLDQTVRFVRGPEEETVVTKLIFRMFLKRGLGITQIARALNERGFLFTQGISWKYQHVRAVLTNESCLGFTVFNKGLGTLSAVRRPTPPSQWKRIKVAEAIIKPGDYLAAQRKLKELAGHSTTSGEMLAKLKRLLRREGRLSCSLINRDREIPNANAYKARFGSIQAAYALIGYVPSRRFRMMADREAYTRETVLARLRALHEKNGYLTCALIEAQADLPSLSYLARHFGSVVEAYAAAGICLSKRDMQRAGWDRRRIRSQDASTRMPR